MTCLRFDDCWWAAGGAWPWLFCLASPLGRRQLQICHLRLISSTFSANVPLHPSIKCPALLIPRSRVGSVRLTAWWPGRACIFSHIAYEQELVEDHEVVGTQFSVATWHGEWCLQNGNHVSVCAKTNILYVRADGSDVENLSIRAWYVALETMLIVGVVSHGKGC